jgi:phosphoenolpyruvate carboxylase
VENQMSMTRKHFEWVADTVAPMVSSPLIIERIADDLSSMNKRFNRDKFLDRAIKAWERNNLPEVIDDDITY